MLALSEVAEPARQAAARRSCRRGGRAWRARALQPRSACGSRPRCSASCASAAALDNRKLKAAGYRFRYTTRETVQAFAEHLRRAPAARRRRRSAYRYEREVEEFLRCSPSVRGRRLARCASAAERRERDRAGRSPTLSRAVAEPPRPRRARSRWRDCSAGLAAPRRVDHRRCSVRLAVLHRRRRSSVAARRCGGRVYAYDHGRDDQIAEGVTVGGVDVGGLTRGQAARASCGAQLLEPLDRPVGRAVQGTTLHADARAGAASRVDIDGSVDEALDALARGQHLRAHVARRCTGERVDADLELDVTYSQPRGRPARAARQRSDRPRRRATRRSTSSTASVDADAVARRPAAAARAAAPRSSSAALARRRRTRTRRRSRTQGRQAEGHDRASSPRSIRPSSSSTAAPSSSRSTRTSSSPRPTGSRSARSASRRPPGSTTSRTRPSTRPGTCRTRAWAGDLAGKVDPRRRPPRTRSRRAGWASSTAPASTAPTTTARSARAASHGCIRMRDPGRRSSSTTRCRSARRLHRLARGEPRRRSRRPATSSQPVCSREAWWSRVANAPACR